MSLKSWHLTPNLSTNKASNCSLNPVNKVCFHHAVCTQLTAYVNSAFFSYRRT